MQDAGIIKRMLEEWLLSKLEGKFLEKFNFLQQKVAAGMSDSALYMHFSSMPRYVGKDPLKLRGDSLKKAVEVRPGLNPRHWTVDQVARIWLVLHLDQGDETAFFEKLEKVFITADMGEQVALYQGLPLYPYPERFAKRAAEGIRTNIVDVFDAVALDNPYPSEYMEEGAWNQLVLKAAFMSRPIHRIYNLEKRGNRELAKIIVDYAHERWAASRIVSPDIWQAVLPYGQEVPLADIERIFNDDDPFQQKAGALLCASSGYADSRKMLENHLHYADDIRSGRLYWKRLSEEWHDRNA